MIGKPNHACPLNRYPRVLYRFHCNERIVKLIASSLTGLLIEYCPNDLLPCQYLRLQVIAMKNIRYTYHVRWYLQTYFREDHYLLLTRFFLIETEEMRCSMSTRPPFLQLFRLCLTLGDTYTASTSSCRHAMMLLPVLVLNDTSSLLLLLLLDKDTDNETSSLSS